MAETYTTPQLGDEIDNAVMEGRAFEHPFFRIVIFGKRIEQHEYQFLMAERTWAQKNMPTHPAARPYEPVSLRTMPPIYQGKRK